MTNNPASVDDDGGHFLLEFQGDRLDPATLIPLIPLKLLGRPKKKGEPMGRVSNRRMPVTKTGYCSFLTEDYESADVNDQLERILKIVEANIGPLRSIIDSQSLTWDALLFPGTAGTPSLADLRPELVRWAARLELPLLQKGKETIVLFDGPIPPESVG